MTAPPVVAPDPLAAMSPPVRWLLERAAPDEPALELLSPSLTLDELYDVWIAKKHTTSAIRLIAGVLPTRESIWWAWVSARHATQIVGGEPATAAEHTTLAAIERWVVRPDDDARRAAWDAGNVAGLDKPVGMVAAAVFLSGTSVAPPNVAPVPPPPGAAMPIVAGAITIAGASNANAEQVAPTLAAFASQGFEIVKRLGGWEAALRAAHETHVRQTQEYARATAPPSPPAR